MPVADSVLQKNAPQPMDLMNILKAVYLHTNYENISSDDLTGLTVKTETIYSGIQDDSPKSTDFKSPDQPSSSTSSSPRGSAGRSDSPASTVGSLPKESEHAERKRPQAIQELLQSKKARLDKQNFAKVQGLERLSPAISGSKFGYEPLGGIVDRIARGDDDDSETTSSGGSVNGSSAMVTPNTFTPNLSTESAALLMALQSKQFSENKFSVSQQHRIPSAANDSGVIEDPFNSSVPHDRVFAQVPGRLSLLSNVVKYKMTVGEVRRRLMGPEAFNFSLLGALLRRAKMPEKSKLLVTELGNVGISIARGRRRQTSITLLSALTENESLQLASDYAQLTEKEFPVKQLAEKAVKDHFTSQMLDYTKNDFTKANNLASSRLETLKKAREIASEFINLLEMDRSPVCERNEVPILESGIQDQLSTFSMLTHGFGTPAILVGMKTFSSFLESQIDSLSAARAD
uniref:Transcription factor AP-2 C-terminal domain-containing protein n=1 Tax=Panagrolaimus sp. JU765 TaxID=591449 RepID=A0AC34PUN5_9BILA